MGILQARILEWVVGLLHFGKPWWLTSKEFIYTVEDVAEVASSIPGSGRSPGEGNGYPLQYSCLENPKERGAWWATVHGVTKESDTT